MAMSKRIMMERYIKERYPKAVFDAFFDTVFGTELQFWTSEKSEDLFSCVMKDGVMEIIEDF